MHADDIDGDGDLDVLLALNFSITGSIAWYENVDGKGSYGPLQEISRIPAVPKGAVVADMDGDGHLDALSASFRDNTVAWYQNTDGAGTFSQQKVISTEVVQAEAIAVADFDGDGDLDALSGSRLNDNVAWYENVDGKGTFGKRKVIETDAEGTRSVIVADVDGDGDIDVLSGSDGRIEWHENRIIGDSNDDRVFDSGDLVDVFAAGKYEDGIPDNATFDEGDWNQDGEFDSSDLVAAFQAGHYVAAARPLEAEIAAAVELVFNDDED